MEKLEEKIWDYIVIGSGFGGSVSVLRLAEKGYSVLVLEKGKKFNDADFPKTSYNIFKFLWAPIIRCFGFQKITFFREVLILSGVGVGGGSLVYANTHMQPEDSVLDQAEWCTPDFSQKLKPFYDLARKMLGTHQLTETKPEDDILKSVATEMGQLDSWHLVPVGVYFGDTKEAKDPYFDGKGPLRKGCIECAGCMVGCRHGAKNTLDKNYLWLAEKVHQATILAERKVSKIEFNNELYHLTTESSTSWFSKDKKIFRSKGLVVSGGVLGTLELLLKSKYQDQTLTKLSDSLGDQVRTNSESLCGITSANQKLNHGVAITSVFNPDEHTHVEIVKYPEGSSLMARLGTMATGPGTPLVRTAKWFAAVLKKPFKTIKLTLFPDINRTIILLVMQKLDNAMRLKWKKSWFGGQMKLENKLKNRVPAYIESGQQVMYKFAEKVKGEPANAFTEIFFDMSTTAHILGGIPMSENPEKGVINPLCQVHHYPNFYILDGSIIQTNLGVNPSLTITAISEYVMDTIPSKNKV